MKNINELNEILCEQIDALRTKSTTPKEANAICNVAGQLVRNVKLQIEYAVRTKREPSIALMEPAPTAEPAPAQ